MTRKRQAAFDGERLVLVTGHTAMTVMTALLVLAGASGSIGFVLAVTFVGERTAGRVAVGLAVAAGIAALLVLLVVRRVRRHPRPSLQVTADGVDVQAYGDRWQVPWADVRSVRRWQSPLGDFYLAVDVDPAYWARVGRRWYEKGKGGVHGAADDVSDLITFPVRGMTLAQALRHTREVAPSDVRVDLT